jgi:hypothetical protein
MVTTLREDQKHTARSGPRPSVSVLTGWARVITVRSKTDFFPKMSW